MSVGHVSRGGTARQWRKLRAYVLLEQNGGMCHDCGIRRATEVHHLLGQHDHPEHALDVRNLIGLCEHCHQLRSADQRAGHYLGNSERQQHQYPTKFSRDW
jgi:5-methylcytosine-specific restriction endonuclease McrA